MFTQRIYDILTFIYEASCSCDEKYVGETDRCAHIGEHEDLRKILQPSKHLVVRELMCVCLCVSVCVCVCVCGGGGGGGGQPLLSKGKILTYTKLALYVWSFMFACLNFHAHVNFTDQKFSKNKSQCLFYCFSRLGHFVLKICM